MRINKPVTQTENEYPNHYRLVSITTPKGVITYANKEFCEVARFPLEELVGQAHNIIRHPDMPQAAFQELWDTTEQNKSWMGAVKNRCKNGDYYWVDALVTPIGENGRIDELQSVRKSLSQAQKSRAEWLYARITSGNLPWQLKWRQPTLTTRLFLLTLIAWLIPALTWLGSASVPIIASGLAFGAFALAAGLHFILKPLNALKEQSLDTCQSMVARYVYTGRWDDIAAIQTAYRQKQAELEAITSRVMDSSDALKHSAEEASDSGEHIASRLAAQKRQSESVAAAATQMSQAIQEVAAGTQYMADHAEAGSIAASECGKASEVSSQLIKEMQSQMRTAADTVKILDNQAGNIKGILHTVSEVAKQTNLLALNAAIEAARAGESGRGFSVVADEVRALAQRTQSATTDIDALIGSMNKEVHRTVEQIQQVQDITEQCVQSNDELRNKLEIILSEVDTISSLAAQNASTVEQQAAASAEVAENIEHIDEATEQASEAGRSIAQITANLKDEINSLQRLVQKLSNSNP